MKRFFMILLVMVMIPYVTTLAWTGRIRTDNGGEGSAEQFLIGAVAAEIRPEYGMETLKAQAVLARTEVWQIAAADSSKEPDQIIREEEFDMDCLSRREMERQWGKEHFEEYYEKICAAVRETEGLAAEYGGDLIEPFYCRAAAGKTRTLASYPYLCSVESPGDLEAEGFLCVRTFSEAEFAKKINGISDGMRLGADGIAEKIQIIERDDAGYVKEIQIGNSAYSGDLVRDALGLSSSCFHVSSANGKIRVSSKGIGSGYGFSQAGAAAMEREQGSDFKALLQYYFPGVEIVKLAEAEES